MHVRSYATQSSASGVMYLALLDQVREFRDRHWKFTKEYILKFSAHPVATGGSPITTWLPNQLDAVLKAMSATAAAIDASSLGAGDKALLDELSGRAIVQRRVLEREVKELRSQFKQ